MPTVGVIVNVDDVDRGFEEMLERMAKAKKRAQLTVGIHEEEGAQVYERKDPKTRPTTKPKKAKGDKDKKTPQPVEITLAQIGEIHEFGSDDGRIPQRSWLGDWFDENEERLEDLIWDLAAALYYGDISSPRQQLEQYGNLFVAEIQKRIADGIEPPNTTYTIAMKGSSTPLIDTGQFRGAITYKVEEG